MKKLVTILLLITLGFTTAYGQQTKKIKTSDGSGYDAHTWSLEPEMNFGTSEIIAVRAWTSSGTPHNSRAYFYFDLGSLPSGATITGASFNLYSDEIDGRKQDAQSPDSIILNMVTGSWNETGLTWNSAPSISESMRTSIMQNTDYFPIYSFDVTKIVKYWQQNPDKNKGVRLAFKNESPYTIFYVASSENIDTDLHPELEITYTTVNGIEEGDQSDIFNLSSLGNGNYLVTSQSGNTIESYSIYNLNGQIIESQNIQTERVKLPLSHLPKGVYIFEAKSGNNISRKRLVNY